MGPLPTSRPTSAGPPRWPALDGLRGLAVLAVMAYHLGHLQGGYLGVDLFFVLSGFLITTLLLREGVGTGQVDLRRFWVRRARRLLPALAVALVGVVVAARIWLDHRTLPALRVDALAAAGYIANWRFATQTTGGYFAADPSPLRHTWSLAIEEQYYLVWPLVVVAALFVARRRSLRPAVAVGVISAAGATASVLWTAAHADVWSTDRLYLGTDTRLVAPMAGATLACLLHGHLGTTSGRARRRADVLGTLALVGLVASVVLVPASDGWMYQGGFALMALLGAGAVAGGVLGDDGFLAHTLGRPALRWVGERSYGLYLYSWPTQIILAAQGLGGAALAASTVGASFVLAAVSYRFLEMPIRRGGLRALVPRRRPDPVTDLAPTGAGRRSTGALVALSILALVGVVVAATVTSARPDPLTALGTDELQAGAERPALDPNGAASADARVLVVGDSVGYTLGEYAPDGVPGIASVDARALPGCGLITSGARPPEAVAAGSPADYDGCAAPVGDADRLGLEGDPDVVLLVTGAWESSDHEREGRTVGPGDPGWRDEVRGVLDDRITDLSADGAVVALWADPCGPDDEAREHQAWFNDEVLDPVAASRGEAVVIRPSEVACAAGRARVDVADVGDPRPDDGQHWSEPGAAWLWETWLGPTLHDLGTAPPTGSDRPTADAGADPGSEDGAAPQPPEPLDPGGGGSGPVRAVAVGDSIAFTLSFEAEARAGAEAAGVELLRGATTVGCGLLRSGSSPQGVPDLDTTCGPISDLEDDAVAADPDVVLAMWGAWEVVGVDDVADAGSGRPEDPEYTAYVRGLLRGRLVALGAAGAEVALLGVDCWPTDSLRTPSRLDWWRTLSQEVAAEVGATYLDPTDVLCRKGVPRTDVAGVGNPRTEDGAHWYPQGAEWFWPRWLGPQLRRLVGVSAAAG